MHEWLLQDPEHPEASANEIIVPGMYTIFIEDWLKVYPRDQFLFLRFEDYRLNRTKELDKVAEFLETGDMDLFFVKVFSCFLESEDNFGIKVIVW